MLATETGRYTNINMKDRLCFNSIQQHHIWSEYMYHFLLIWPSYRTIHTEYLPKYVSSFPASNKYHSLLCNKSKKSDTSLAKSIHFTQRRMLLWEQSNVLTWIIKHVGLNGFAEDMYVMIDWCICNIYPVRMYSA